MSIPLLPSRFSAGDDDCEFQVNRDVRPNAARPRAKVTLKNSILILDEDNSLSRLLSTELGARGFSVDHLQDATEATHRLKEGKRYDLLLVEPNLSKIDGISLIRMLRMDLPKLGIFVITSRNRVEDRVQALQNGADDCMTKPLSLVELFARIDALLRRNTLRVANELRVADLTLNREEHRVERGGRRILLTPREFSLLDVMMQNAGCPVSRGDLMERVWKVAPDPSTNIVDVYMKYLRDKVDHPSETKLINTIRGFGYELVIPD